MQSRSSSRLTCIIFTAEASIRLSPAGPSAASASAVFMIIYHNYEIVIKLPYVKDNKHYTVDDSYKITDYDLAVLSLYICENIEGWIAKRGTSTVFYDEGGYHLLGKFILWENGYDYVQ